METVRDPSPRRVMVTGGAGVIGSHLTERLLEQGDGALDGGLDARAGPLETPGIADPRDDLGGMDWSLDRHHLLDHLGQDPGGRLMQILVPMARPREDGLLVSHRLGSGGFGTSDAYLGHLLPLDGEDL